MSDFNEQKTMVGRRKVYLKQDQEIDPTDYEFARKFVTEHGKILPARLTGASSRQQRKIKKAVRRARVVGLIS